MAMADKQKKGSKGDGGRIPRENLHDEDQDERLTHKHIQTLGFLQEIVNENKALKIRVAELEEQLEDVGDMSEFARESKQKIKDIQESYLAKADEVNSMLAEKHRIELMQVEEEKLELERELKEQILKMRHEVNSLNAANKDLRVTAAEEENNNEDKKKLKESMKHAEAYRQENEELRAELEDIKSDLEILQSKRSADMSQTRDLKNENRQLQETVQELQQKNNELELLLDKAKYDLKEKANDQEQRKLIENLRDKIRQLTEEREAGVERETRMGQDLLDLSALKDELRELNSNLQSEIERLLAEYGQLRLEYDQLYKRSMKDKDTKSFKDFVSLKRELRTVKYENDALKSAYKDEEQVDSTVHVKKHNSLEGKRKGAKKMLAISMKYSQSAT